LDNQGSTNADFASAQPKSPASAWSCGLRLEALGNLAHELRTPLQVLIGYLDILRDEFGPAMEEQPRDIIERMNTNVYDLAQTIENLMEFVLSEARAESQIEEEVAVRSLVADVAPALEAANLRKKLKLVFDLDDAPKTIRAPRGALRAIVLNLALNAIKFTETGAVTVALRRTHTAEGAGAVEIAVSDTGPGMTPEMLDEAARPFAQLSNTAARRYRGLGLGLALVRRKAAALGGNLELRSTPGQGAQFTVRFPARAFNPKTVAVSMPRGKAKATPPIAPPPPGRIVPRMG
jgi:signal transduction histidine kinase